MWLERGSLRLLSMRNSISEELTRENDNEVRWRVYLVQLPNSDEISEVGGDVRRTRIRRG